MFSYPYGTMNFMSALAVRILIDSSCTRWRGIVNGLSQDGGRNDLSEICVCVILEEWHTLCSLIVRLSKPTAHIQWMRSSRVVRAVDFNAEVATMLRLIRSSWRVKVDSGIGLPMDFLCVVVDSGVDIRWDYVQLRQRVAYTKNVVFFGFGLWVQSQHPPDIVEFKRWNSVEYRTYKKIKDKTTVTKYKNINKINKNIRKPAGTS